MFQTILKSFYKNAKVVSRLKYTTCTPTSTPKSDSNFAVSVLENGVRIATEETSSPIACVSLCVAVGSRFEDADSHGITHFVEHLAYKGYCKTPRNVVEEGVFQMGARLTAKTERETQTFSMILPSAQAPRAIDFLFNIITDLALNDGEVERESANIELELKQLESDPKAMVYEFLHEAAFQGTPLAQSVVGPSSNLQKFRASFAAAFMCNNYQPYRFTIATTGDVPHDMMVMRAQRDFGTLFPQPGCELKMGPCRFTGSLKIYRVDSMPLAHVAVGFEAPGYTSPDYYPMLVASHLMGSWTSGQVAGTLNAARIAQGGSSPPPILYSYEPFYFAYQDVGLWGVYFVAKKLHLDDVWHLVQDQLMNMCVTTTESEAKRARNNAKVVVAKEKYSGVLNVCRDIGEQIMYTMKRSSYSQVANILSDVTAKSIRKVGNKYVYDRCPVVAAMGPTECLPDYNRIKAGTYWLRF